MTVVLSLMAGAAVFCLGFLLGADLMPKKEKSAPFKNEYCRQSRLLSKEIESFLNYDGTNK